MEILTIVGSEADSLILVTESGARFSLRIDDILRSEVRRADRSTAPEKRALAASPREIQAQIRAGLTADEVAELLNVAVEDVARFEGAVLAEREHIIGQALAVPVVLGTGLDPDVQPTFGTAMRAKLAAMNAASERWASWKDEAGWMIKLAYTANDVGHDARWTFDPRRSTLTPANADAARISKQSTAVDGLIPRLHAVGPEADRGGYKDSSRFDSGAFGPRPVPVPEDQHLDSVGERLPSDPTVQAAATNASAPESTTTPETADLLEALRRRRGQRESAPTSLDSTPPVPLFDALSSEPAESAQQSEPGVPADSLRRKRRNAMPSWDEIVFGARTED